MKNLGLAATILGLLVHAPGCSSSKDAGDPDSGPGDNPDASARPDAAVADCSVAANLGDLPTLTEAAATFDSEDDLIFLYIPLDQSATPDFLAIELWEGFGVFEGGFAAGTYTIAGDETNLLECGACVALFGDVDNQAMQVRQIFMASSGTIDIEQIDTTAGGRLKGTVSSVALREVTLDQVSGQTDVPGGCTSAIGSFSFDVPVQ
jgi:hypothetical protein